MNASFWIWFLFVALVAGIGLGSMLWAYFGQSSVAVVFPEPVATEGQPVPTLNPDAAIQVQQGAEALRSGHYRKAVSCFSRAAQLDGELAIAYHNRGRAVTNLRRINEATADFLKAGELYLQQNDTLGYAQVKQDLETLRANRKVGEATRHDAQPS